MVIGLVFAVNSPPTTAQGDPKILGYVFTTLGGVFLLLAAAITIAEILASRYLTARHSSHVLSDRGGLQLSMDPHRNSARSLHHRGLAETSGERTLRRYRAGYSS
jgi:hypothetical protein